MKGLRNPLVWLAIAAALLAIDYFGNDVITNWMNAITRRPELVLLAVIGGLLSSGLNGIPKDVVLYGSVFITYMAWEPVLGIEASVPFWRPGWHFEFHWITLVPAVLSFVEAMAGFVIASILFTSKADGTCEGRAGSPSESRT